MVYCSDPDTRLRLIWPDDVEKLLIILKKKAMQEVLIIRGVNCAE